MLRSDRLGLAVSVFALALAVGHAALAQAQMAPVNEPPTQGLPGTQAGTATTPPSQDPLAESRAPTDERYAEAMAERDQRYQDLRQRAAEVGMELPETPPWEQDMPQPPMMPHMAPPARLTPAERNTLRDERYAATRERAAEIGIELPETPPWKLTTPAERQAYRETMRNLTPDQRLALHRLRWEEMRGRAKERGIELPESPPWERAQQHREAMEERWRSYRETVEALTEEQREAAAAVFGGAPFGPDPFDDLGDAGPGRMPCPPMMGPCDGPGYDQGRAPFGPPGYPQGPTPPYGSGY